MKLSAESLLSPPPSNGVFRQPIERPISLPVKVAEEFKQTTFKGIKKDNKGAVAGRSDFSVQYAHIYGDRLWTMRPILEEKVNQEWQQGKDSDVVLKKIAELCQSSAGPSTSGQGRHVAADAAGRSPSKKGRNSSDHLHEQHIAMREDVVVVIIGTIFKQQPEKPSILQELVEDNAMIPIKPRLKYISDGDKILLEDETSRVQLVPLKSCGMKIDCVVNGVVCAVKGKPTIHGMFDVEDVLWATPNPSVWPKKRENDVEMIFVSGLLLGSNRKNMSHLDLLFDYLQGLSGSPAEHETLLKPKTRLFLVGDTFGNVETKDKKELSNAEKASDKISSTQVAKKLDDILDQLSQTMEVYIIPGQFDPAEPMFPQAPIHRCILPKSSRRTLFHSMCNPTRLQIPVGTTSSKSKPSKDQDNTPSLDIIFSGGQNIVDAMKNTSIQNPLEMAHNILRWGHLCPTAPDTLALHPAIHDEIFVLKTLPNIFIVGGQPRFAVREWKDTCIVTLPKFAETGIAVVLDKQMNFVPLNIKLVP